MRTPGFGCPRPPYLYYRAVLGRVALLSLVAAASSSLGASINFGSFGPVAPGIQFVGVTESSDTDPVPLYGAPTVFGTGLDFDPQGFTASIAGGGTDATEGRLELIIRAAPGLGLSSISTFERGDYTLAGVGTSATSVMFENILRITVTEINGVGVAPFALAPVNASAAFNLAANSGVVQPLTLGLDVNIADQLAPGQIATEVQIVIENSLTSASEAQSVSFGSKKDFRLSVETIGAVDIPETGSTVWLLMGGVGLALLVRRWPLKNRPVSAGDPNTH